MHIYIAFIVYACMHWGVHREICSVLVRVLCRCAALCIIQCIDDLALHRSHRAVTTAVAVQV